MSAKFYQAQEKTRPAAVVALDTYKPSTDPGRTDFDVADRLAIQNVIYAYALAYDNYEIDTWFSLFAPDATFAGVLPGGNPVELTGAKFHQFWRDRSEQFKTSLNKRRHLMPNITFIEQTPSAAHVSVVGLLTNARDGTVFFDRIESQL